LRKLLSVLSSAALLLSLTGSALAAAPARDAGGNAADAPKVDNLPSPMATKQNALKQAALEKVMSGEAQAVGKDKVVKLAPGQYVQLARQGEDKIWTVLGEFGDQIHPSYGGTAGPAHNEIPEPDRSVDNSTIWAPDFTEAYYQEMLFNGDPSAVSMRNFYLEQSSNRYTVNGEVEDWVQLPYNEARYGADYCGSIVCATTWYFVRDTVNAWYAAQLASGMTKADVQAYLAQFDTWDRYDANGDGIFTGEQDHYIDHFQAIHAGEGEETGGGAQGTDAIWSHRWYAFYNNIGFTGPDGAKFGGIEIGDTGYWIGDYTVEPENGGVGVFSHEFGHDLGLPDLYDTSGNTGGAENSTGFWTLYSSGSYGNSGVPADGIGSKPISMSVYEKIFLGWSDYAVVGYGQHASVKLSGATSSTKQNQAVVALLPDKSVDFVIGPPAAGDNYYYSGSGDDLDETMTKSVTLPAGAVGLTAKVRYNIEEGWDYAYLTVNGTPVHTNLSTSDDPYGQNFGEGITGVSDNGNFNWVDLTADLSAYAGQTVTLGFRYWTDGAQQGTPGAGVPAGIGIDEIAVTGQPVDGAESDAGWTFDGFKVTTGTDTFQFFNAYFAEYRNYVGYDDGLRTGPYNFGFLDNPDLGNWVEHFPYQDGLLVWYYDTSFNNNNVGDHCLSGRCGGLYLPVDAHPNLLIRPDNGKVWRARVQSYDSTFGLEKTDKVCLHMNSIEGCYGGLKANPVFNDNMNYWVGPDASIGNLGWFSVEVPHTGTTIRVVGTSNHGNFMQVTVN
jgi:immune inhibitor A